MATETVIARDHADRHGAVSDAAGEITAIADMLMREVDRDDDPLQLQRVLRSNLSRIRSLGNLVCMAIDPAVPIEEVRGDLYFAGEEVPHG